MASGTLTSPGSTVSGKAMALDIDSVAWKILRGLGSLRITVWGFFLAIVILLVGTLAQDEETIPDVKRDYFNAWIVHVPLDVFKPVTIWPEEDFGRWSGSLPFPGGALIGLVLLINLIAAKLTRFKMVAKGGRLVAGLAFCLVGATITAVVILGAHAEDGLQGEPPFSYDLLWSICRWTIWVGTLASFAWAVFFSFKTLLARSSVIVLAVLLAAWSLAIVFYPETLRIPDPGLRIVWQMAKSLIAGGILLAGLILLFGRRGGNVLIHLAIGMLMLGQFVFGDRQIEEQITLADGETTSMALRLDEHELALIDTSAADKNHVIAIDQDQLLYSLRSGKKIVDESLPFQILVKEYYANAKLNEPSKDGSQNLATQGNGLRFVATSALKAGGAKEEMNLPAGYIEVFSRDGKTSLGTYLISLQLNDAYQITSPKRNSLCDSLTDGDKSYQVALRLRREYKDYDVTLKDVQRVDYTGSTTVRDFSSFVTFTDRKSQESLDGRIWMNNPMRYRGETFYQKSYSSADEVGKDTTGLQVVRNAGWLMPYIACAFAALGMLAHFGGTFARFASRFDRERLMGISPANRSPLSAKDAKKASQAVMASPSPSTGDRFDFWESARAARRGTAGWLLPLVVVAIVGGMFAWHARIPTANPKTFNWYQAGSLPMQHEGRIKPVDSVARNILQALSGRTSTVVRAEAGSGKKDTKYTATEWFYGVIAHEPWIRDAKVFRIDAKEVLDVFGLEAKESGGTIGTREMVFGQTARHRYSYKQLEPKLDEFIAQARKIKIRAKENPESLRFVDQKFLELDQKLNIYLLLSYSYSTSQLPTLPQDLKDEKAQQEFAKQLFAEMEAVRELEFGKPAGMIPPVESDASRDSNDSANRWRALRPALFATFAARVLNIGGANDSPAIMPLLDVVDSVRSQDAEGFNKAIASYREIIREVPAARQAMPKAEFEAWYNHFGAFSGCIAFYIIATTLAFLSMLIAPQALRRTAFWITLVVFLIHLAAILARVYITGRAPVINLYSSAVYIGCGAVLFGLILESLFPIRIGLLVGTIIGSTSLLVAYGLDTSDTMPVLQAVLDTQFWLTTHVQCITAGYLATFVAGGLAIGSILHRVVHRHEFSSGQPSLAAAEMQRILHRITYGTICFAIFFSLIGTVLGGLWADDSWGRFWGWDPKENGALMIVLWNAIVLHARWDKLVRERGFALLAIGGNIVTAWSWFGTNQLGIGLHSYGFTSGVLMILTYFVFSQILIIAVGSLFTMRTSSKSNAGQPLGSWE